MPRQKTMYLELGEVPSLIDKYKPASIPIPLNDPSYLQPPGKKENGIEATVMPNDDEGNDAKHATYAVKLIIIALDIKGAGRATVLGGELGGRSVRTEQAAAQRQGRTATRCRFR